MTKRKKMKIAITSKEATIDGKYRVNWGSNAAAYNTHMKTFKTRKDATKFKNDVAKIYKGIFPIDYMYIAD